MGGVVVGPRQTYAVVEVAGGERALLSEAELGLLHEKLVWATVSPSDFADGAQLAADWIDALRSGLWNGVIPLEGAAAEAVGEVLGRRGPQAGESAGLGRLHDLLHAELTRPMLRLA